MDTKIKLLYYMLRFKPNLDKYQIESMLAHPYQYKNQGALWLLWNMSDLTYYKRKIFIEYLLKKLKMKN